MYESPKPQTLKDWVETFSSEFEFFKKTKQVKKLHSKLEYVLFLRQELSYGRTFSKIVYYFIIIIVVFSSSRLSSTLRLGNIMTESILNQNTQHLLYLRRNILPTLQRGSRWKYMIYHSFKTFVGKLG